ncbi:hypothetical protein SAMN04489859_10212 [Paracoccus alcaliphilus]|uniref:Uncharacterized protein n=1 Tax=Paracoccus alcaliphilus TaxID=34002 RepID=A0A1H8K8S7_9RHOB|nr:hypothetical protein SAMN04489859_10212 [Paracoccus alcaliphilus]
MERSSRRVRQVVVVLSSVPPLDPAGAVGGHSGRFEPRGDRARQTSDGRQHRDPGASSCGGRSLRQRNVQWTFRPDNGASERGSWPFESVHWKTIQWGLLKKLFQAAAGFGRTARISMIEQSNSIIAAASFLRFMAMAVRRACILMFSSPLRMALASSWSVLAVPWVPSTRQRCRVYIAWPSFPHARRLRRARKMAAWFVTICTLRDGAPRGRHCALRGQRAQSCRSARYHCPDFVTFLGVSRLLAGQRTTS